MYLEKNNNTDGLFIVSNIRIYCGMNAAEFEVLLYTILPEEPFNNQIIHIIE